jgi:hypothetical protein
LEIARERISIDKAITMDDACRHPLREDVEEGSLRIDFDVKSLIS